MMIFCGCHDEADGSLRLLLNSQRPRKVKVQDPLIVIYPWKSVSDNHAEKEAAQG